MKQDHIIHRQKLRIKLDDQNKMFQVREFVHREMEENILPGLDMLFSELAPAAEDTVYHIQSLHIDIGMLSYPAFEKEFSERVLQQLTLRLKDVFMAGEGEVLVKTSDVVVLDALLHYLHYGFIPWWYKSGSTKDVMQLFKQELTRNHNASRIFAELNSTNARSRFLQLAGAAAEGLVAGAIKQNLPAIAEELQLLLTYKSQLLQIFLVNELSFQEALLASLQAFITKEVNWLPKEKGQFVFHFIKLLAANVTLFTRAYTSQGFYIDNSLLRNAIVKARKELSGEKASLSSSGVKKVAATNVLSSEALAQGLLIDNAGIILLYPFLPQLFKTLALTDEKGLFPDGAHAKKTAVVLQYLVTGADEGLAEFDLVLNKILCGLDVEEHLNPDKYTLTAAEKEACEEMLAAVIAYWEVLKNTSNNGLREGFLMRSGSVRFDGGNLLLRVERKTQDILLEKLPWGLSIVKFPFLKSLIYMEW